MRASVRIMTAAALVALAATACTVKKAENPPSSGPSELALSLAMTATPDILPQDGSSQSQIVVLARDGNARPVSNLSLRVDMIVNNFLQDFGTLSTRTVVTGGDGRASLTYTAPAPVHGVVGEDVSIQFVPVGTDASGLVPRTVTIRLVSPGGVIPNAPQVPNFTITPANPTQLQFVTFDASDPNLDSELVRYHWNFGDGSTTLGRVVNHSYKNAGSFAVTLTVTNTQGASASRVKSVTVTRGQAPTAAFTFSPAEPTVGDTVFFNASGSTPASGRTITQYRWDMGDGPPSKFGQVQSHAYGNPGKYRVTLTVTDNVGVTATTTQDVEVKP